MKYETTKQNFHKFDLEERTFKYALAVKEFTKKLQKTLSNNIYISQIIRSSSSIAANYIEANESLSAKDFLYRIRISRKENKETRLWLKLLDVPFENKEKQALLLAEGLELLKIFSSIIGKSQSKNKYTEKL